MPTATLDHCAASSALSHLVRNSHIHLWKLETAQARIIKAITTQLRPCRLFQHAWRSIQHIERIRTQSERHRIRHRPTIKAIKANPNSVSLAKLREQLIRGRL